MRPGATVPPSATRARPDGAARGVLAGRPLAGDRIAREFEMKRTASIFLAILFTAPAGAVERGTAAQRAACTPDVFRLCASEIPNVDGIVACLHREKARLSSGCRVAMGGGEDRQVAATRSLRPTAEGGWCVFDGPAVPVDDVWRSWCERK
jgi:hypothetical protein